MLILIIVGGSFYAFYASRTSSNPCSPLGGQSVVKSQTSAASFGGIEEFSIPGPSRWSNGIATAPDGSVWFGEQSVPGFGHLFPSNGTVVEYAWPPGTYRTPAGACDFKTSIWGVALWNGMVWGSDGDFNGIVGFNQTTGQTRVLNVSKSGGFPYTLTVGPDGDLWFTLLSTPATVGKVATDYSVSYYKISGLNRFLAAELQFLNSTRAYVVTIDTLGGPGGLYYFDPRSPAPVIDAVQAGPGFKLASPTSVSIADGSVWVTQHGAASVAAYNVSTGAWTAYPTSTENFTVTTLPYFVRASGSLVWFNEHYANKIALIDRSTGRLTEYSESDPPVSNLSAIGNDLTIALASGGLWFTSVSGDYIGFASSSFNPGFSLSVEGSRSFSLAKGDSTVIRLAVSGSWSGPLTFKASDTESLTSAPLGISITPSEPALQAGATPQSLQVNLKVGENVTAGSYTVALTLQGGLTSESVYIEVMVANSTSS